MRSVLTNLTQDEADVYGLVLSSSGIPYSIRDGEDGWDIYVHITAYDKALNAIEQYLRENQDVHRMQETLPAEYGKTFTGMWVALILVAMHVVIVTNHDSQALIKAYSSSAHDILRRAI